MLLPPSIHQNPWMVAVSGGADSMALLYKLHAQIPTLQALHFNHGFEDENGDEAEAFVREVCQHEQIPLHCERCRERWVGVGSKEAWARQQRYNFFLRASQGFILLGHHANDVSENFLLRLMRGSGLEGLLSFGRETQIHDLHVFRPLLDETHEQQIAWLQAHHYTWIEDCSNTDTSFSRNALRQKLMKEYPLLNTGIHQSIAILREENDYLNRQMAAIIQTQTPFTLQLKMDADDVLVKRALRNWLISFGHIPTQRQLLLILQGETVMLNKHLRIHPIGHFFWERLEY